MPRDLTDDKSTLVQVMAWCRQATSHYLNQCWPRSLSLYGVTKGESDNEGPWLNRDWKWIFIIQMVKKIWAAVTEFSQETENFHPCVTRLQRVNPCCAEFILENIKIHLYFPSFLNTEETQVVEILRHGRQGPVSPTYSLPWLLVPWQCKEPGH